MRTAILIGVLIVGCTDPIEKQQSATRYWYDGDTVFLELINSDGFTDTAYYINSTWRVR